MNIFHCLSFFFLIPVCSSICETIWAACFSSRNSGANETGKPLKAILFSDEWQLTDSYSMCNLFVYICHVGFCSLGILQHCVLFFFRARWFNWLTEYGRFENTTLIKQYISQLPFIYTETRSTFVLHMYWQMNKVQYIINVIVATRNIVVLSVNEQPNHRVCKHIRDKWLKLPTYFWQGPFYRLCANDPLFSVQLLPRLAWNL